MFRGGGGGGGGGGGMGGGGGDGGGGGRASHNSWSVWNTHFCIPPTRGSPVKTAKLKRSVTKGSLL